MAKRQSAPQKGPKKKGGKFFPALCNIVGTIIILGVILLLLPSSLPRIMGYEIYNVVSGSMAPAMPQGSLVFVRPVEWSEIREGDVIAFSSSGTVVTHRVVKIKVVEGEFVTKGDANESEDVTGVPFDALLGRVERHVPVLGGYLAIVSSRIGKLYLLALLICGVLFHVLAGRLREVRA